MLTYPALPVLVSPFREHTSEGPSLDNLSLPELHPGQQHILATARRFNVCALGRRFGKTELAKVLLCDTAYVQGGRAAYCAPTGRTMVEFWNELKASLAGTIYAKNESTNRLELTTGGIIELWSLERPDAPRGRRYHRLIIDEAAQVRALGYAWQAVLRLTLADYQGDAWWFSTPRSRNYFWQLFRKGDPTNPYQAPDWMSWRMSSYDNPYIHPSELDDLVKDLPEQEVQQEVYAQFLENQGLVFRQVREAAHAEWQEQAIEGHGYIMGVDLARSNDWTVITIIDTTTQELVFIDRFRQLDYQTQRPRIIAAYERFGVSHAVIESNSMGWPNIEELRTSGLEVVPFNTTSQTKKAIIDSLVQAFELGRLAIPPDEGLIDELLSFEMKRLPSGLFSYSAPEGQHDDQVMSLALAWAGVTTFGGGQGRGIATG